MERLHVSANYCTEPNPAGDTPIGQQSNHDDAYATTINGYNAIPSSYLGRQTPATAHQPSRNRTCRSTAQCRGDDAHQLMRLGQEVLLFNMEV